MRMQLFEGEAEAGGVPREGPALGIYAVGVSHTLPQHLADRLTAVCSPHRKARLGRFLHPEDARRSLMAEMLARAAIGTEWLPKRGGADLAFGQDRYGKPYVIGHAGLHFNLSHSGHWCVCAVSPVPVGVDVEQARPMDLAWTDGYLSAEEREDLHARDESGRLWRFYEIWTRKESYAKALGRGLLPEQLAVSVVGRGSDALLPYRIRSCPLDESHPAAVCAAVHEIPGDWKIWTAEEIADRVLRQQMG